MLRADADSGSVDCREHDRSNLHVALAERLGQGFADDLRQVVVRLDEEPPRPIRLWTVEPVSQSEVRARVIRTARATAHVPRLQAVCSAAG